MPCPRLRNSSPSANPTRGRPLSALPRPSHHSPTHTDALRRTPRHHHRQPTNQGRSAQQHAPPDKGSVSPSHRLPNRPSPLPLVPSPHSRAQIPTPQGGPNARPGLTSGACHGPGRTRSHVASLPYSALPTPFPSQPIMRFLTTTVPPSVSLLLFSHMCRVLSRCCSCHSLITCSSWKARTTIGRRRMRAACAGPTEHTPAAADPPSPVSTTATTSSSRQPMPEPWTRWPASSPLAAHWCAHPRP